MSDQPNQPESKQTMEDKLHVVIDDAKKGIYGGREKCEERIRKSPTKAVLGAFALGYFLPRMPVRVLVVTQVRILAALTTPALFVYKAAKLYDFVQEQREK